MYAYREVITLDNLQRLILSKPLPLVSGQSVEVLVVADYPKPLLAHHTWQDFFVERDHLLAERPDEIKGFMSERTQLREQQLRDPFEGWVE
ncbi:hypothetical protein BGP_2972 [Beggiatoa sp. PS]|nr:hypothetical protein BGP_2972 [Beggiatoa sp. PS]